MHTNRAYACIALGQKQKAVADLSFAIEREKKTNALLNDLAERGHLYCDLKDFPKALTDANRMVSVESEYIDGYRLRATVYEGMGKHDLAKKDHDTAAKLGADWVLPKS
jgi:tetratricopeptide (TPR) repeat protein